MLKQNLFSRTFQIAICALILSMIVPLTAMGQRRWIMVRPHRSRVVVYNYQPQPYVMYRRPYYGYRTYTYGYQPYYSYGYSQPYFANRYAYSWANPAYRYSDGSYYRRHRHNRVRVGLWLR
jgi:hypothetical protein